MPTDTNQVVEQAVLTTKPSIDSTQKTTRLALFDSTGAPVDLVALLASIDSRLDALED